ncbi:flagellar basal body L-ring protein FlgH, partial [Colwellia marinimaniae]|uniref:flagellar basal body L-ring protein FlgH n=1 Tax=Colwellia marinimaniae TaxID=1513592 RepID=UPI00190ED536
MRFFFFLCSSPLVPSPFPYVPYYSPFFPASPPTKIAATGSMYQDSQASSLYSDIKALKVGDIITVILMEATQATK